jgi:hypothetical protein
MSVRIHISFHKVLNELRSNLELVDYTNIGKVKVTLSL